MKNVACTLFVLKKGWVANEINWLEAQKGDTWSDSFTAFTDTLRDSSRSYVQPFVITRVVVDGGGDYVRENMVSAPVGVSNTWEDYDVKAAVQAMIKNQRSNNGFILIGQTFAKAIRPYHSSESDTIEKRPKLTITYEPASINHFKNISAVDKMVSVAHKRDELRITVSFCQSYNIMLVNAAGKTVYTMRGSGPHVYSVPESALSKGMYLLSIKQKSGISAIRCFIDK